MQCSSQKNDITPLQLQILSEQPACKFLFVFFLQDVFAFLPGSEIRRIREENPTNLATLCYKVKDEKPFYNQLGWYYGYLLVLFLL